MNRIWVILMMVLLPLAGFGQGTEKVKGSKHEAKNYVKLPPWAAAHNYDATAHVYFPDYYVYYDPARGGYVYWEHGQWTFSPSVPPYLEKVDLSKERVQILKGLSLDLHPEMDYPHYMKLYPAEHKNDLVPVPGNH
jgi:hypothetical protein